MRFRRDEDCRRGAPGGGRRERRRYGRGVVGRLAERPAEDLRAGVRFRDDGLRKRPNWRNVAAGKGT